MSKTEFCLGRVMSLLLRLDISREIIDEAAQVGSFNSMRKLEQRAVMQGDKMRPGDQNDPESFKTRRGVVGGFRDYLDDNQVKLLDERVDLQLRPEFGYSSDQQGTSGRAYFDVGI